MCVTVNYVNISQASSNHLRLQYIVIVIKRTSGNDYCSEPFTDYCNKKRHHVRKRKVKRIVPHSITSIGDGTDRGLLAVSPYNYDLSHRW